MRVIGYTYDADHHCFDCTFKYVRQGALSELDEMVREFLRVGGVFEFTPRDSENNEIHPIFDTDEWYANDIYEGNKVATLNCSGCGEEMDRWESS